jgi:hypothetical protein
MEINPMRDSTIPKTIQKWIDKNKDKIDEHFVERYDEFEDGVYHTHQLWICLNDDWITEGYQQHDLAMLTVKEFENWRWHIVPNG